jgi:hypothetical protein
MHHCPGSRKAPRVRASATACDRAPFFFATCAICDARRTGHAYTPDRTCAVQSSRCTLCRPPPAHPKTLADLSHMLSTMLASPGRRAWDVIIERDKGVEFSWRCAWCKGVWREQLRPFLSRGARRINPCACSHDVRWKDLHRFGFPGSPPVWDAARDRWSWTVPGLGCPGDPLRALPRSHRCESLQQRVGRMCPAAFALDALRSRPPWLLPSFASKAERKVWLWLAARMPGNTQLHSEVQVRLSPDTTTIGRFDFGFVLGPSDIRLIEIDGAQHFDVTAFSHALGGRRARTQAQERDRLKDQFVAACGPRLGVFLLRISTSLLEQHPRHVRDALEDWVSRPARQQVTYFGREYERTVLEGGEIARAPAMRSSPAREWTTRDDMLRRPPTRVRSNSSSATVRVRRRACVTPCL